MTQFPQSISKPFGFSVAVYSIIWVISMVYALFFSTPMAESYWMSPLATIGIVSSFSFLVYSWIKNNEISSLMSARWEDKGFLLILAWVSVESIIILVHGIF